MQASVCECAHCLEFKPEPPPEPTSRYKGWAPYCLKCDTMQRMLTRSYGWQCAACKNKINHDLTHHYG